MKQLITKIGAAATVFAVPAVAFAQGNPSLNQGDINVLERLLTPFRPNLNGNFDIATLAIAILNFVILLSAILAIFYLIWAGIQYITASTDEEKAKKARAGIYNAVIGIVVILLSFVIIQYVSNLTGSALRSVDQGTSGAASGRGF